MTRGQSRPHHLPGGRILAAITSVAYDKY